MSVINEIKAREILDSRGNPTVEAEVILTTGEIGRASVPSGASTGSREALELRDNDKSRYLGRGVFQAVSIIRHQIAKALAGKNASNQQDIDEIILNLDGTKNKDKLGANAMLAVSLAVAKAASQSRNEALYHYLGAHSDYLMPV